MVSPFLTVVEPPIAPAGDLPRMDVAAMAGFAEAGPFGVPVRVESPDAFAAVFGRPVTLPGGPGALADAVGAFFAQGARRAWIVRCGDERTVPAMFPLPGLIAVGAAPDGDDDRLAPATLEARSPGTFADDVRIGAAVRRERIVVEPAADGDHLRVTAADRPVTAGALAELPLLRGDAVARRFAILEAGGFAGTFVARPLLTASEPPALDPGTEMPGVVGASAARMARDDAGRARVTVELALDGAPPAAIGGLVRFRPDEVAPQPPAETPRAPEPDTWVLVDDVSAAPAGTGNPRTVLSGPAAHVDRDPGGVLQAGLAAVLTFDLFGRTLQGGARWQLEGLGCAPAASGWPGALPTDAERYAAADGSVAPAATPVCGANLEGIAALVPVFEAGFGVEAAPVVTGTPAARNGLAGTVRAELLGRRDDLPGSVYGFAAMLAARDRTSPRADALPGIVALLDASEATLLAVPDAVAGEPAARGMVPDPEPQRLPPIAPDTAAMGFGACGALPATPALGDVETRTGGAGLSWVLAGDFEYEVGRFAAADATAPAEMLYRGPGEVTGSSVDAAGEPAPVRGITLAPGLRGWARVRGVDVLGRAGGWSVGVRLPLAPDRDVAGQAGGAAPEDLRTVHRVLLRLAAVRGDALAVLALPARWTAAEARAHVASLQADFGESERRVLACGTLAHPWPRVPAPSPVVARAVPADAAFAGQLAAMAASRGAWIAVSDRALRDAVDTAAAAGDRDATGPANRYVTTVLGVRPDSQDTLALDEDDRPVNVRRLLALVRRAALERGQDSVFEPNGPSLWRALHRDMDGLLATLHERGAFRPARASDAYRVDVFPGDGRGDDGVVICELRVAPSRPLRFVTIRLERRLDGALAAGAS